MIVENPLQYIAPATKYIEIDVSAQDWTPDSDQRVKGVYVGGGGDIKVDDHFTNEATFKNVSGFLPISVSKVYFSGTTASDIIILLTE